MEFIHSPFRSESLMGVLQILEPRFEEPRIVFKTKDLSIRKTLAKINVSKPCLPISKSSLVFCNNSSTKCLKHGAITTGFMAFKCVRKLIKVLHTFEDCFLKFPRTQLAHDYSSKYCFQCFIKLSEKTQTYVFRNHLFCSLECRYEAYLVYLYNEKVMKAILGDYGSDSPSRMDEQRTFTIGST